MTVATTQEIVVLKKAQEEVKMKAAEEIKDLKKETNFLVLEKEYLFTSEGQVKEAITNAS